MLQYFAATAAILRQAWNYFFVLDLKGAASKIEHEQLYSLFAENYRR
jgi:hypothetical protein